MSHNPKTQNFYRHGDVNLNPVSALPEGAKFVKKATKHTVALGEVTGHHHTIYQRPGAPTSEIEVWELGGVEFLVISEPLDIKHQEHDIITIAPGVYKKNMEIEEDPFTNTIRQVRD